MTNRDASLILSSSSATKAYGALGRKESLKNQRLHTHTRFTFTFKGHLRGDGERRVERLCKTIYQKAIELEVPKD